MGHVIVAGGSGPRCGVREAQGKSLCPRELPIPHPLLCLNGCLFLLGTWVGRGDPGGDKSRGTGPPLTSGKPSSQVAVNRDAWTPKGLLWHQIAGTGPPEWSLQWDWDQPWLEVNVGRAENEGPFPSSK